MMISETKVTWHILRAAMTKVIHSLVLFSISLFLPLDISTCHSSHFSVSHGILHTTTTSALLWKFLNLPTCCPGRGFIKLKVLMARS